jgi:NAD+ diphosphatase
MDVSPLFFSDGTVDRCNETRLDENRVQELRLSPEARYLLLRRGRVKAEAGRPTRIAWARAQDLGTMGIDSTTTVFLGMHEGQPRFAVIPVEAPLTAHDRTLTTTDDGEFVGLRKAAMTMTPAEAQLAAHAVHLSNWINRNRYCGLCAAPTRLLEGGHKLACSSAECGREEFPRTDAVVIALVVHGDRCFLARQPSFPPKFYSALAGFVEPGETLENALRREVREEAGIDVGDARYIASQPWPFPTSLMVGYLAEATNENYQLDHREIEDGRWFDRREIIELLGVPPGAQSETLLPLRGVMARRLIEEWIAGRGREK